MSDDTSHPHPVLLRHVIDSLPNGVVVAAADGRCLLSNPAARRLLGRDPAEVAAGE